MTSKLNIAIVGAGISGLTLAYRLQQNGHHIQLFEKGNRAGGTIQTHQKDGFIFEKGPDGFLQQKTVVRDLAKELGIESDLITTMSANRRSLILQNGKLIEVPDGFYLMSPAKIIPFLRSPLLSWRGKVRTLLEPLVPKKKNGKDESLACFIRRRFGRENLEKISQAMLGGIYTADPEQLSMQAALPRFVELEKRYGSVLKGIIATMAQTKDVRGPRYGLFGSFKNGMSTLVNTLVEKLQPGSLHLATNVESILYDSSSQKWAVKIGTDEKKFDHVCLAVPAHAAAKILSFLSEDQKKTFQSIPYAGSAILHFAFKSEQIRNRPAAVGFIVPHKENKHLIACSFMSNKYENRAPAGYDLIRVFAGGAMQEEILQWPIEEMRRTILEEVRSILNFEGDPVMEDVAIWPKSMPQYTMGHIERSAEIKRIIQSMPNLHILGNAYCGVGIPDLIERANGLAEKISNSN